MYRCTDCGYEFEELMEWQESRGEYFGFPCHEIVYGCPNCKGTDYEEVEE